MTPCPTPSQPHVRSARSQRWRERRAVYVPDLSVIDPGEYAVDVIADRIARAFTVEHHYSGSHPVARLSLGLFRNGAGGAARLVGVATFSVPINDRAVARHTGLTDARSGADLGRFVLLDEVAGNARPGSWPAPSGCCGRKSRRSRR